MAQEPQEQEIIEMQGELAGHTDWVTCLSTSLDDPDTILSGSRDKTVIVWKLDRKLQSRHRYENRAPGPVSVRVVEGKMMKRLVGHNHFVQDIDISSDRQYALSASWDGTLRLWNLLSGETHKRFDGHKRDVLSVAFSADNRKIVSGSMDKSIKVWNVLGDEKGQITSENSGHKDWVTCTRFSPNPDDPVIVTCGRDKLVKVWERKPDPNDINNETVEIKHNLMGHTSYVNSVTVSPDGSLCASGGKDGIAMLWDLNEGKSLSSLDAKGEITCLTFSPNRYWLCGAVGQKIVIWDLETKEEVGVLQKKEEEPEQQEIPQRNRQGGYKKKRTRNPLPIHCTCICWSQDGKTLYAGYTDGKVQIWSLISNDDN